MICQSETLNLVEYIAKRRSLCLTCLFSFDSPRIYYLDCALQCFRLEMSSEERKNLIGGFGADKDIPCVSLSICCE